MWIFSVFDASGDLNGRLLPSKPSEVENDREASSGVTYLGRERR